MFYRYGSRIDVLSGGSGSEDSMASSLGLVSEDLYHPTTMDLSTQPDTRFTTTAGRNPHPQRQICRPSLEDSDGVSTQ